MFNSDLPDDSVIGSPLKRHRGSIYDGDEEAMQKLLNKTAFPAPMGDVLGLAEASQAAQSPAAAHTHVEEEEL